MGFGLFSRVRPAHTNVANIGPNKSGPIKINSVIYELI